MFYLSIRESPEKKRDAIRLVQQDMLRSAWSTFRTGGLPPVLAGPQGKPYLQDTSHFHYNFSDSAPYIALMVSETPVGLDLQEVTKGPEVCIRMARRFYPKEEAEKVLSSPDPARTFHRLWTIKEAYLKLTGVGLSGGMNSYAADEEKGIIYQIESQKPLARFLSLTPPDPGFYLTLCYPL